MHASAITKKRGVARASTEGGAKPEAALNLGLIQRTEMEAIAETALADKLDQLMTKTDGAALEVRLLKAVDQKLEAMNDRFDRKFEAMNDRFDRKFEVMNDKFDQKLEVMSEKFMDRFAAVDKQFSVVKDDIAKLDMKISDLAGTTKADISELRGDMHRLFAEKINGQTITIVTALVASFAAIAGVMFGLMQYFAK